MAPRQVPQVPRNPKIRKFGRPQWPLPEGRIGCCRSRRHGRVHAIGQSAEDYGKALGRCLEEYNRLEGRPPRR